jgi:hypothetical protein
LSIVTWRATRVRTTSAASPAAMRAVSACRVARDVQHGLDELLAVAAKLGNRGVVVAHHAQAARMLGADERMHAFADLMDVHVGDDVLNWCGASSGRRAMQRSTSWMMICVLGERRLGELHASVAPHPECRRADS